MKKAVYLAIAVITALLATQAQGQVFIRSIGNLGPGDVLRAQVQFPTGGEVYVGVGSISANAGMEFDTTGSTSDTEIAAYGPAGNTLLACNDDGGTDSGTGSSYGLQSYIWNGVGDPTDPGSAYYGPTCPTGGWDDSSQAGNISGGVTLIVGTFAMSWDENNAADTPSCGGPGFSSGDGVIRVEIF